MLIVNAIDVAKVVSCMKREQTLCSVVCAYFVCLQTLAAVIVVVGWVTVGRYCWCRRFTSRPRIAAVLFKSMCVMSRFVAYPRSDVCWLSGCERRRYFQSVPGNRGASETLKAGRNRETWGRESNALKPRKSSLKASVFNITPKLSLSDNDPLRNIRSTFRSVLSRKNSTLCMYEANLIPVTLFYHGR